VNIELLATAPEMFDAARVKQKKTGRARVGEQARPFRTGGDGTVVRPPAGLKTITAV
jgi:hypothetical protein